MLWFLSVRTTLADGVVRQKTTSMTNSLRTMLTVRLTIYFIEASGSLCMMLVGFFMNGSCGRFVEFPDKTVSKTLDYLLVTVLCKQHNLVALCVRRIFISNGLSWTCHNVACNKPCTFVLSPNFKKSSRNKKTLKRCVLNHISFTFFHCLQDFPRSLHHYQIDLR